MIKKISLLLLLLLMVKGCGGLKYIQLDEKTDKEWKIENKEEDKKESN